MTAEQPWADRDERSARRERWLVGALVILFGLRLGVVSEMTVGALTVVGLGPVWWRRVVRFVWAKAFFFALALAVVVGWWLSWTNVDWLPFSDTIARNVTGMMLELGAGVALFVWARGVLGIPWTAVLYGLSLIAHDVTTDRFSESPWRFGVGTGLTVALLGAVWLLGRPRVETAVLGALTAVWAVSGGRSAAAVLAIVLAQTVLQRARAKVGDRLSPMAAVAGGLAIGLAVFTLGQAAVLRGYLGGDALERSAAQTQQGQNILAGGRPEFGATIALFVEHPTGYGIGAVPTGSLVTTAKQGLARLGYDPNNGYVENYMFGRTIELHSTGADLWATMGLGGVLLVLVLGGGILAGLSGRVAALQASPLLLYLGIMFFWDIAFSPMRSSTALAVLTFSALIPSRSGVRSILGRGRQAGQIQVR
jgi:hypothetical protein